MAGLIQAANGDLYGTTGYGGANVQSGFGGGGTIFKITPSGTLTTLYKFCSQGCIDGELPRTNLVQAADGDLYGTTSTGGIANASCQYGTCGTIFKVTATGTLTTLHKFCSEAGCADGATPYGGLVQASNGALYGTASTGGISNPSCYYGSCGTIFKITPDGTLTTIYNFCSLPGCADGFAPQAGLVQAPSGDLYGVMGGGGTYNHGTVYKITLNGTLTILYSFCSQSGCPDGDGPTALIQGTNGIFYGTTYSGGSTNCAAGYGCGTIFAFSTGQAPFVETRPTIGKVGEAVTILGYKLTGATGVTFNGIPASFTVDASTEITTTVPAGATTGKVQVITPSGALSSNIAFEVAP